MNVASMHTAVRILLDKIDSLGFVNFEANEIDFFLNTETERFIKHRMSGNSSQGKGFEETQKRTDDLRNVTKNAILTPEVSSVDNKPNGRFVLLPNTLADTYWFSINEEATVLSPKCGGVKVISGKVKESTTYIVTTGTITYGGTAYNVGDTFEGTAVAGVSFTGSGSVYETSLDKVEIKPLQHDDYNKTIRDPFNKPVLEGKYKQIRRLQLDGKIELLLPEGINVLQKYIVRYIRKPQQISLISSTDCELADHTHAEIIEMVVARMSGTIEAKTYSSNLNELKKLE